MQEIQAWGSGEQELAMFIRPSNGGIEQVDTYARLEMEKKVRARDTSIQRWER